MARQAKKFYDTSGERKKKFRNNKPAFALPSRVCRVDGQIALLPVRVIMVKLRL